MRVILVLFFALLLASITFAADVCVVVYSEDFVGNECISINEGADGEEVLDKTNFNILWSPESTFGQLICKINGIGTNVEGNFCKYDGEFWNFVVADKEKWQHAPVGLNGGNTCWNRDFSFNDFGSIVHYCAKNRDLIGFAFGKAGTEPFMFKVKDIKIRVDGKKKLNEKTRLLTLDLVQQ